MPLLTVTDKGLYCADADLYVDPWAPVPRALITHAHSDHVRSGAGRYYAAPLNVPLLRERLPPEAVIEALLEEPRQRPSIVLRQRRTVKIRREAAGWHA